MSFLLQNSILWPLLLLTAVPILLHLFARTKPPVYNFSSNEFIRKIVKTTMRLKRPVDLLFLFLISLFLRPLLFTAGNLAGLGQKSNLVVIVDATASMGCLEGGQGRFSAACAEASALISGLKSGDRANVIWLRAQARPVFPGMGVNFNYLQEKLRREKVSDEAGDIEGALKMAGKMLSESEGKKEICIISDFQTSAWDKIDLSPAPGVDLITVKVGESEAPNQAVARIFTNPAAPLLGEPIEIFCETRNFSNEDRRRTLFFKCGEYREKREITIPAWGGNTQVFNYNFRRPGEQVIEFSLNEDLFPEDNSRLLIISSKEHLNATIVTGACLETADFWEMAFDALDWIKCERIDEKDLKSLGKTDVLMLAGWRGSSPEKIREISNAGATTFCYPAPKLSVNKLKKIYPELKIPDSSELAFQVSEKPWRLKVVDQGSPIFKLFADGEYGDPAEGDFLARLVIPKDSFPSAKPLFVYRDDTPALVKASVNSRPIWFWNISLNPEYSNFAKQNCFLPIFAELILTARNGAEDLKRSLSYYPGKKLSWAVTAESQVNELSLMDENGGKLDFKRQSGNGEMLLVSDPIAKCGLYTWLYRQNELGCQAVNFPLVESDFRAMNQNELEKNGVVSAQSGSSLKDLRDGVNLWPYLLAAVICLILVEGLLSIWAEKNTIIKKVLLISFSALVSMNLIAQELVNVAAPAPAPAPVPKTTASPKKKIKDYSAAFAKFAKYGLPDVSEAEYVGSKRRSVDIISHNYELQNHLNAGIWLFKERKKDGKVYIVSNSGRGKFVDEKRLTSAMKKLDIKKEVDKIFAYIQMKNSNSDHWEKRIDDQAQGALFLFANFIFQKGHKKEANELLELIFDNAGDHRRAIFTGFNIWLNSEYGKIFNDFNQSGDWQAYHDKLSDFLKRFAFVSLKSQAMKEVLAALKKRLEKPLPEIHGENLTAEDHKIAKRLITEKSDASQIYGTMNALWVLIKKPNAPQDKKLSDTGEKKGKNKKETSPIEDMVNRKMKSIPLLIALLNDDTFCYMCSPNSNGPRSYNRFEMSGRHMIEEDGYVRMNVPRPITRGELAQSFLSRILTFDGENSEFDRHEAKGSDFKEYCVNWYNQHKLKSPKELAELYLWNGEGYQSRDAIDFLLDLSAKQRIPSLEKYILEYQDPHSSMDEYPEGALFETYDLLSRYVTARGKDSKDLLKQYEKNLKSKLKKHFSADPSMYKRSSRHTRVFADSESDEDPEKNLNKKLDSRMKYLRELFSDKNIDQILEDILKQDKKEEDSTDTEVAIEKSERNFQLLESRLEKGEVNECIGKILRTALKSNSAGLSRKLITFVQHNIHSRVYFDEYGMRDRGGSKKTKPDPLKNPELWRKLLEKYKKDKRLHELIALTNEYLYSKENMSDNIDDNYYSRSRRWNLISYGEKGLKLLMARVKGRLDGKGEADLPSYPDPKSVNEKRRKAIAEEIFKTPEKQLGKVIKNLTLSEELALSEVLEKNQKLNKHIAHFANRIRTIKFEIKDDKLKDKFSKLKGELLSKLFVEKLIGICKEMSKKKIYLTFSMARGNRLEGFVLTVMSPGSEDILFREADPRVKHVPYVSVAMNIDRFRIDTFWRIKPTKEKSDDAEGDDDQEEDEDEDDDINQERNIKRISELWKQIERVRDAKINCTKNVWLAVRLLFKSVYE